MENICGGGGLANPMLDKYFMPIFWYVLALFSCAKTRIFACGDPQDDRGHKQRRRLRSSPAKVAPDEIPRYRNMGKHSEEERLREVQPSRAECESARIGMNMGREVTRGAKHKAEMRRSGPARHATRVDTL
jgi:hypothetical protein